MPAATTRLTRSIPFWGLVVASLAAIAFGAWIGLSQLSSMTTALTDGTATNLDVYTGPSWIVLGAVLLGAGVVGVLLSLGIAAVATLFPSPAAEVIEPPVWDDAADEDPIVEAPIAAPATVSNAVVETDAADEGIEAVEATAEKSETEAAPAR